MSSLIIENHEWKSAPSKVAGDTQMQNVILAEPLYIEAWLLENTNMKKIMSLSFFGLNIGQKVWFKKYIYKCSFLKSQE